MREVALDSVKISSRVLKQPSLASRIGIVVRNPDISNNALGIGTARHDLDTIYNVLIA